MLSTLVVLAYACIAVLAMRMTFREYQANQTGDRWGLLSGLLACLCWPVVAFFLLLMLNLNTAPAKQFKQTI